MSAASERPIGLQSHNPGYLPINKRLLGAIKPQEGDIVGRFKAPQFGIGAMGLKFQSLDKLGVNTVADVVAQWPMPAAVDRAVATVDIAKGMGVDPGDWLDMDDYATAKPLAEGLILAINGRQPYKDVTLAEGLRLGRIHNAPQKSLFKQSGFTVPALFAGLNFTAMIGGITDGLRGIAGNLAPFAAIPELRYAAIAFVGINTGLGLLLMVNKLRKQNKGLNG